MTDARAARAAGHVLANNLFILLLVYTVAAVNFSVC